MELIIILRRTEASPPGHKSLSDLNDALARVQSDSRVRGHTSPQSPPLRTARASFPASGSSIQAQRSYRQFRTDCSFSPILHQTWVVWASCAFDFHMALNRDGGDIRHRHLQPITISVSANSVKSPRSSMRRREVFVSNPAKPFLWMSA